MRVKSAETSDILAALEAINTGARFIRACDPLTGPRAALYRVFAVSSQITEGTLGRLLSANLGITT
jgi:hypothetical protein